MSKTHRYRKGYRSAVPAEVAGKHLTKLQTKNGGHLSPKLVVDDARREESPIHGHFEWNDIEAAEQFRLGQARYLMRAIEVVVEMPDREETAPMFVSIQSVDEDEDAEASPAEPAYWSFQRAMTDPDARAQVLSRALAEADSWRKRYEHLQELAAVFAALDKVAA